MHLLINRCKKMSKIKSPHRFYIPIMGTGFTIDSALAVAKYGISSVLSLVDDVLIEQMRKFWCEKFGQPYQVITVGSGDHRAKRITAYLNLLHNIIEKQITKLKATPFEADTEITRYYEMLPKGPLKQSYENMLAENDSGKKVQLQNELRQAVVAGSIDVNIMTKLDCQHYLDGNLLPYEFCDAASALRGYANSNLSSSIVFSAGFNPNLYGYIAKFKDFFPDENGELKKKICLKVSDYRSAAIQGKYLAKHGLWVSEYSIESPLNCGGHAFINDGQLIGPILEEFKQRKNELLETLYKLYKNALNSVKKYCPDALKEVQITAQGGVGTYEEHQFLLDHYELDGVGWGTPFLLVPEVTNVDKEHLDKLLNAKNDDVYLSASSPLNVPFWNLRNSASEEIRRQRIDDRTPGNVCGKGFAKVCQDVNGNPICRASRGYQTYKLKELDNSDLPSEQLQAAKTAVLSKSCICQDLAGGATIKKAVNLKATPAICPGPNIINFKKLATLKEMVNHIYGYCSLMISNERPHMFIREIQLQIEYLVDEVKNASQGLPARSQQKLCEVKENICAGISYYRQNVALIVKEQQEKFLGALQLLQNEIEKLGLCLEL